jgi:predicted DNA-binding transcriptional regulator AlpA
MLDFATGSGRFLTITQVSHRLGVCTNTINRWVRQGRFPGPQRIHARLNAWTETQLAAWESARTSAPGGDPAGAAPPAAEGIQQD